MQDTKPLQLSNTFESAFTLPLAGQEKCWISMPYKLNVCRPNSFGTINDYFKISVFSTSGQQHLLTCRKCLSFAKLYSGPHKLAELFSLFSSVRNSYSHELKGEVWLHSSVN